MSDGSDFDVGDNDIDDRNHDQIVEKVLNLNKVQQLKKSSRTEPTLKISEFNLVKSITGKKRSVQLESLTKSLKNRKKHIEISNKLEASKKKSHTLPKPLEKPQAERIRRTVGYEKSRFEFDRWEALVQSNRAAAHQVFPLGSQEKIKTEEKNALKYPSSWRVKSSIQKELEKLDNKVEEYNIEDQKEDNQFPLSLKELKEQRHEAAKLRAHQSFKEAKARRQNKIKSKKYHRILSKERVKKKLKEFEELQKTDPEAALKKLEEIEKARAMERFSLRHKSTGQWAKSKQVRAKYDKDSRQVLAQQLSISRELTQKLKNQNSDSEDDILETPENDELKGKSDQNPWINGPKPDKELSEFYSGYKKFWSEQDKLKQQKNLGESEKVLENIQLQDKDSKLSDTEQDLENCLNEQNIRKVKKKKSNTEKVSKSIESPKKVNNKRKITSEYISKTNNKTSTTKKKRITKEKSSLNSSSGEWDIDQIFEKAEIKLEKKLKLKAKAVEKKKPPNSVKNKKPKSKKLKSSLATNLAMPKQSKKHVIDEEMIERANLGDDTLQNDENILELKNILKNASSDLKSNSNSAKNSSNSTDILPDQFLKPKTVTLDSANPDLIVDADNTDSIDQQKAIIEAFEDDAIDADFSKDKKEEIDKDTPKDIDLNLPGWGSWAGAMINPKKQRRRKRFIIKMPKQMPRRDENKGSLIINEKASTKIKSHLVSEVPFPFKTVKDFEASIRAPIGNAFVPETAFRKLIRPEVETKMGTIIEPMTKSILMGKRKR